MTQATIDRVEPVRIDELKKGIRVPRFEFELWMETWDWTFHQLARNEYPHPFRSIEEFQYACFCADPGIWVPAFLRDPDDPDYHDPYNIWDYQMESLRYPSNKLHKDGSEVGKTREIIMYGLYKVFATPNGSGLVGAPQQTHLEEIIEGMIEQLGYNPDFKGSLVKHKKNPHHAFYFANKFKIDFRPSGFDGEAYRGVHVKTFAIKDEAAKDKNPKQYSEFFRAMKPGCQLGIYSVPDGDRSCDFFRLGKGAIKTGSGVNKEEVNKRLVLLLFSRARAWMLNKKLFQPLPEIEDIYGTVSTAATEEEEDAHEIMKNAPDHLKKIKMKLFHWPKKLMPFPYWSQARKDEYIELYGGEDSALYIHNVEGEDGDPEYSVFPWEQLKHCIKDIPEYRCLKILVNSAQNEVSVKGTKIEVRPGDTEPIYQEVTLMNTSYSKTGFFDYSIGTGGVMTESEFRKVIKNFFLSAPGLKRGGADFGFSGDPTEIIVKNIIGKKKRLIARLQLKHVTYDQQCQALDAMDDIYGPQEAISWGDDFGNAGSAVTHTLQGEPHYAHKNYDHRLKGFQFESTTDNIDRDGNPMMDAKNGKPARIYLKELATDVMTKLVQEMEAEYPGDPDIIFYYPNHTYNNDGKHRIYKKQDDHLIDADRAETLAEILGSVRNDHYASGCNTR